MANKYDELLNQVSGKNSAEIDPVLQGQNERLQSQVQASSYAVRDKDPGRVVEAYKISEREKLPYEFVEKNLDQVKKSVAQNPNKYAELVDTAHATSKFISKPENAAIAKDDIDALKQVEQDVSRFKPYKSESVTIHKEYAHAAQGGFKQLEASLYLLGAAYGKVDPDTAAQGVADAFKRQKELHDQAPSYVKEYEKVLQQEGGDVTRSVNKMLSGWDEYKKGNVLNALKTFTVGTGQTVAETLDLAVQSLKDNPRAVGYMAIESLSNSFPSLAGAAIGGGAGMATGPAAPIAAPVGIMGGTFAGSLAVEVGSTLQEELGSQNIDTSDAGAVAAALRNPQLMARIKERAERKGLTTAAVDTFFSLFAGQLIGKAGKGLTKKAAAAAADVSVQAAGETISEGAGQIAKEKGDLSKVDWGAAMAEGIISIGHSVGETALGGMKESAIKAREKFSKKPERATEQVAEQTVQAVKAIKDLEAIEKARLKIRETKNIKEIPSKVKEMIDTVMGGDEHAAVYFQVDDFDSYWNKKGRAPVDAAAQIMGDGGKAYLESKSTGTPLEMPVSQLISQTATKPELDDLIKITRVGENGMTVDEAQEHFKELPGVMEQLANEAIGVNPEMVEQAAVNEEQAKGIGQDVTQMLMNAGVKQADARTYSKIYESAFNAIAERTGVEPAALYEKYGLKIRGHEQQVEATEAQTETAVTPQTTLNQAPQKKPSEIPSELGFVSKLEQTIEQKMSATQPVESLRAMLREIKPEEMKWSGLDEFLKGKDKVSKEEVQEFLRANQLEIKEVTKGGATSEEVTGEYHIEENGDGIWAVFDWAGNLMDEFKSEDEAQEWIDARANVEDATKFSQYTLPGGENYREVLLTMPPRAKDETTLPDDHEVIEKDGKFYVKLKSSKYPFLGTESDTAAEAIAKNRSKAVRQEQEAQQFTSSHFDEKNILAHVRLNDRTDADGKKVLFVEEIQSDWHQAGRKKGYKGDAEPSIQAQVIADVVAGKESADNPNGYKTIEVSGPPGNTFVTTDLNGFRDEDTYAGTAEESARKYLIKRMRPGAAVPDAPFKKTWHEFALKRILRMAAEGGYDRVAWTTGEQQAERYDLSKQVDSVGANKKKDGTFDIEVMKDGSIVIEREGVSENQLDELVGKELAQKIINEEGKQEKSGFRIYEGLDLKVGGEGMKGFYDNILVKSAEKLVKKFGGKVGVSEIQTVSDTNESDAALLNELDVEPSGKSATKVHSIDITPELKQAAINQGFELFQDGAKGRIRFGTDRKFNIDLLKNADPSTFLHETGHFFLEILGDLAEAPGASQAVKDDWQSVMDWFGVESRDKITTEHHEQWARGFEAYLMDGKAPSNKLKSAFRRFKQWLISVYRQMRNLNVTLTPEVRDVMNRMMATESEIQEAQESNNLEPLFSDPSAFGFTGKEAEKYLTAIEDVKLTAEEEMLVKVMEPVRRKENREYKARRKQVKDEVTRSVDQMQLYKLLAMLQRGRKPDGADLDAGVTPIKLDRQVLIDRYGAEFVKNNLPRPFIYSRDGGVHPDVVADMYGFTSGDEMINQLVSAVPRNQLIEQFTEQQMLRQYPDILSSDEALETAALEVIHSDKRSQLLALELEMLWSKQPSMAKKMTRKMIRRSVPIKFIKEQAVKILGQKQMKMVRPAAFLSAEKKASVEAAKAFTAGDFEAAYIAKEKELLNHELYKEALSVKDKTKKHLDRFKKVWRKDEDLAKSRDLNFINAARAVLTSFGIGRAEKKASEYLDELKRYDPEGYETINALVDDAIDGAAFYKDVSVDKFTEMAEAVQGLWDMSKRSKEIVVEGNKIDKQAAIDELTATIQVIGKESNRAGYNKKATKWDKIEFGLASAGSLLRRVEQFADTMDMGEAGGAFKKYVFNPISESASKYRIEKKKYIEKYLEIVKGVEKTITRDPIVAKELNYEFDGKQELLGALLHVGNDSNKQKLLLGRGWATMNVDGRLNSKDWDLFIERMHKEGVLVKADWDFVQNVWDMFEQTKVGAQQSHYDMYGYYFSEITANTVVTPFGEYRGGYAPALPDSDMVQDQAIRNQQEQLTENGNAFMFPTAGKGFTKKRVEKYTVPLQMDLGLIPRHIDKVLRFTHIEPRVKDVGRIMFDKGFRKTLDDFDKSIATDMVVPWLQRSARQQVEIPSQGAWRYLDAMFKTLRRNTGLNIMTANVMNTLQQVTGLSIASLEVKHKFLRNSLWSYVRSPKKYAEMITEKSKFMSTRVTTNVIEVQNHIDELLMNPSKYEQLRDFAAKHGYFLQSGAQGIVDVIVWGGRYDQAVAEGLTDADAVRAADRAVRATQGSFNPEDLSSFEVGSAMFRAFTMFYSYFNMQANVLSSKFIQTSREMGLKKGAGKLLYIYVFGLMIPAIVSEAIMRAGGGEWDEDDDDSYLDDLMSMFFLSQFRTMTAFVPYVGQATNTLVNTFNDKPYDDRISISPAIQTLESTLRAPKSVYDAIVEDKSKKRATRDVLTAVGLLTGVPVAPLGKPLGYLMDVDEGEANPTGPIDFTRGLITGRPGDK